mgnify:CR=1 FL=1
MHWILATLPDGKKAPVNLDAIPSMQRGTVADGDKSTPVTLLFLGGIAVAIQGQISYAITSVLETPEELLALPKMEHSRFIYGSKVAPKKEPARRKSQNSMGPLRDTGTLAEVDAAFGPRVAEIKKRGGK